MFPFAFMLKSYSRDLSYAKRLLASISRHNKDSIPIFIVIPGSDIALFEKILHDGILLIAEEEFNEYLVKDSFGGFAPGYLNQEIIKLAFWEKMLCRNYLCLDSDAIFIKDFFVDDFMYNQDVPYTILVEDNELKVDPNYFYSYGKLREKSILRIKEDIGIVDRRILTCNTLAIFSANILASFKKEYLTPNGMSYADVIKRSPYEYSWYNMWLQKTAPEMIFARESLFKVFHIPQHYYEYIMKGVSLADIRRGYLGLIINSNASRRLRITSYDGMGKATAMANSFSFPELTLAWFCKFNMKNAIKYFVGLVSQATSWNPSLHATCKNINATLKRFFSIPKK